MLVSGHSHLLARRLVRFGAAVALGALLAACQETSSRGNLRAYAPIPSDVLALMQTKGTNAHQPVLIRAFKKEAELEIWKMRSDGRYVHLKTYPMCRWSGQLGPKTREGDRQVPEGFYTITPGQMNPNSAYYLSFNVGYPNAYDRAHGYSGGSIMVHGACSSAGCFSMTDEQIAEIYAITREAFGGGQRAIQMQSLPFRMTADNLAKHRFDPNMKFWKDLKEGVDQFEVSQQETKVGFCGRRYVFGADGPRDANAACPPLQVDPNLKALVAEKQRRDEAKVAELVAAGTKPVKLVYADGGQHPDFANRITELSRPEAVEQGPREIVIDERGKPVAVPAVVQVASAAKPEVKPAPAAAVASAKASVQAKNEQTKATVTARSVTPVTAAAVPAPAAAAPAAQPVAANGEGQPFYKRWMGGIGGIIGGGDDKAPEAAPAAAPQPAKVPLPPKRQARNPGERPQASLERPVGQLAQIQH
jgi:murein L,D-transpeptidase YafK